MRRIIVLTFVGLAAACGVILLLVNKYEALGKDYQRLQIQAALPQAGYIMPTFRSIAALTGDSLTVGETSDSASRQLLFVLTTTCPYCKKTLPLWAALADSARKLAGWRIAVVAISLDSAPATGRYAVEHALPYPVTTFPIRKLRELYRARAVPQTMVLDHQGRVLFGRTGVLEPSAVLDSIYQALTWRPPAPPTVAADSNPGGR
jgi:thiol-disulfide isomerase/thioredoxin